MTRNPTPRCHRYANTLQVLPARDKTGMPSRWQVTQAARQMAASSSSDDEDSWPSSSSSQCCCRPTGSGASHRRSAAGGPRPAPASRRGAPDSQSLGSPAGHEAECAETPPRPSVLSSFDLDGVAEYVLTHGCSRIIVMVGAGISVSAGLPDFRTPGSGLYDNLAKYDLPEPTAVFNIDFFRQNPAPFYLLAKELFPGQFQPTPTHHFIRLLHDRGLLLRCFTQNIDSLEAEAGIPRDKIVAAHGNFDSATCLDTGAKVPISEVREAIMAGEEGWRAMNARWGGLVKPDISFFGERLPERFYERAGLLADSVDSDFAKCDLLIVMGTSLVVQPFASLIDRVPDTCPRLLLNRQPVALYNPVLAELSGEPQGFRFRDPSNWRDVCFLCSTDDGVKKLAARLGWSRELDARVDRQAAGEEHRRATPAAQASCPHPRPLPLPSHPRPPSRLAGCWPLAPQRCESASALC